MSLSIVNVNVDILVAVRIRWPSKPVPIVAATGATGSSILNGLLDSGNFTVIAGVRPSSASKPEVIALKSRGVEIRILDLEKWTVDQLAESLKGIDTVISTIYALDLVQQKPLVDAAKKADVKRFVPDDWGTACVRGVRKIYDSKLAIQDYIKGVGIGYTFIDVGWMQVTLPFGEPSQAPDPTIFELLKIKYGKGDVKTAVTDRRDIGKFVARIIADERTLNQYVFCWSEEVTQNEAFALAKRVSGRDLESTNVSEDELLQKTRQSKDYREETISQYTYSIWIRGDNTVENAKKPGYGGALDAKELCSDLAKELTSLEEYAKKLYLT